MSVPSGLWISQSCTPASIDAERGGGIDRFGAPRQVAELVLKERGISSAHGRLATFGHVAMR